MHWTHREPVHECNLRSLINRSTSWIPYSYSFASVIIFLAIYFLYCWNKDQQMQDENLDDDPASFDIDLVSKRKDSDSNLT